MTTPSRRSRSANDRPRVDGAQQHKPLLRQHLGVRPPGSVVADGDDRTGDFLLLQFAQNVGRAQHLQPADGFASEGRVGIDESDGLMLLLGRAGSPARLPVPAGSDDDAFHERTPFDCAHYRALGW